MNNKGFTLVEVIVTIVILGITTMVALPVVSTLQGQLNNNKYKVYQESLESSAKLYTDSYDYDMFGRKLQGCVKLTYNDLADKKLLSDIELDKNITCDNNDTFVTVIKTNDTYTYQSSLKCTDENGNIVFEKSDVTNSCPDSDDENTISIVPNPEEQPTPVSKLNEKIRVNSSYGFCSNISFNYQWISKSEGVENTASKLYEFKNAESTIINSTHLNTKNIKLPEQSGVYTLKIVPEHVCDAQANNFYTSNYEENDKLFVFDFDKPTISVDYDMNKSTNNVTLKLTDNMGVTKYAFVTSEAPSNSDWKNVDGCSDKKNCSIKVTVPAGTYKFYAKDEAGNKSDISKEIKIDRPTAPVIAGGASGWYNTNRIIWVTTESSSLVGIAKYQYCISNSNSSSSCSWTDLYNNTDGVSNSGLDVAFYHSRYEDLKNTFGGSVFSLNDHYTRFGRNEGRYLNPASDPDSNWSNWIRSSQNFSYEGNKYVFFRAVTVGGLNSPASNAQHLKIDKTKPVVSFSTSSTSSAINVTASASDNLSSIKTYYYKIDNNNYVSKNTNTHSFTGLGSSSSHTISVYVVDGAGNKSDVATKNASTLAMTFGEYLRTKKTRGFNTNVLGRMYRYTGGAADNYVCIGTNNKSACVNNKNAYMYRVIGVVQTGDNAMGTSSDMVKVIKASISDYVPWGDYSRDVFWNSCNVRSYVNNINYGGTYENMIANINWRHGTNMRHTNNAQTMFNIEASWGWTSTSKKAIMYASDYLFATGNANQVCTDDAGASACTSSWIYLGGGDGDKKHFEYTMDYSSTSVIGSHATLIIRNFTIVNDKAGALWPEGTSIARRVRPVFYLKKAVYYSSGSGTSNDPFIIK